MHQEVQRVGDARVAAPERAVDAPEVREDLGKVAQEGSGRRLDLFGEEPGWLDASTWAVKDVPTATP